MIRRYVFNLIKAFSFYMLLFALFRLTFLLYFASQILKNNGTGIFFRSLYRAIPLDISAASYLLFVPFTILLFDIFFRTTFLLKILRTYMLITAMLCAILSVIEIGVYRELHMKLYFGLLMHMEHVSEVIRTTPVMLTLTILLITGVLFYLSYLLLNRLFPSVRNDNEHVNILTTLSLFGICLLCNASLIIGIRGGFQQIPINEGQVYFSNNQCVNDATVNPLWNIIHSFVENKLVLKGDVYKVMTDKDAEDIVNKLYSVDKDTTIHLFKVPRPNVCILILESWSADVIESLGGYHGLTPNFEKLITEGYLFRQIKPAGHVSDQGVAAILSGYPALPIGSVINQPERQVDLPNINNELSKAGYYSSFFFGGQLIYGNIKTYIYRNEFSRVTEQSDLPMLLPSGSLGIHDSIMLNIWHDSINTFREPFFSCLFTLSTHAPFDEPETDVVNWGGDYNPYLNSVVFADRQLGRFFEAAKKTKWYNNTIFIIVADHSHGLPKDYPYESNEFYHIPLLIWGGALKDAYKGAKYDRVGSQLDIASTVLHQLDMPSNHYRWSKNMMNPYTKEFAYYTFQEGFGFVDSTGNVVWNKLFPWDNKNTGKTDSAKKALNDKGAAMLQVEMKDYLSK